MRTKLWLANVVALLLICPCSVLAGPPPLPHAAPDKVGLEASKLAEIDDRVAESIAQKRMPGCVILVARQGRIALLKAYGDRSLEPERVPMTTDTVFDLASITKPAATATSVMLLIEQGKLALDDTAAQHWPEFGQHGKERITIRQLLTHQGGLIPDNALADYEQGFEEAMQRVCGLKLQSEPGTKFAYSDVSFIVLGELVRRLTGKDVNAFSQVNVFRPLGLRETSFLPAEALAARAAVTQEREGRWMRGEVHDPRAYLMGGVAGHAGLFSTAEDLAVYAQMLHGRGEYGGVRVMKPETVAWMTTANRVSSGLRGLGWDMKTSYSINRGQGLSPRAFGHGGFTGTVLWIDPELELTFIFLSNRVHPDGKGLVNPLAGKIATLLAQAVVGRSEAASEGVLTGLDVLVRDGFAPLKGRRVGLITNHTGISRDGKSTVELIRAAAEVKLVALFSPEHGFEGKLDVAKINDASDPTSGLPIYSLYGESRKPSAESMSGIDTLVFDIQDIGARFYTYPSTMALAMEAAAEHGLRFVVLDRPNPINGVDVDGPVLDEGKQSFVGFHTLPVRHGLTLGELATLYKQERQLKTDLHVIKTEGWRRRDYFDVTGLPWVNPSPNMRSLTAALLYPGIGLLETTNISVGRGTDTPFEVLGAPWIDARRLAAELNSSGLAGVRFVPLHFTPDSSKFKEERCGGVNVVIVNRDLFEPLRTGFTIAAALRKLYPEQWEVNGYARLLCDEQVLSAVKDGRTASEITRLYQQDLQTFHQRRRAALLYAE